VKRVCIAGAGLAGLYLAVALARRGIAVQLHERREASELGLTEDAKRRSIALALSHRGLHALGSLGLEAQASEIGRRMLGRVIHQASGELAFSAYDPTGQGRILAVQRAELYELLAEAARREPLVTLRFGQGLRDWAHGEDGHVQVRFDKLAQPATFDALLGADGADSRTRATLERQRGVAFQRVDFEQAYKEVRLRVAPRPAGQDGLHIWPRDEVMLIGLPGRQTGELDGTLFLPRAAEAAWFGLDAAALQQRFAALFPDLQLPPGEAEALRSRPLGRISTIEGGPWCDGPVLLVGDAAHAVTPFLGQGMNCALEDCELLLDCLDQASGFAPAFLAFYQQRREDAQALGQMSTRNLQEMMVETRTPAYARQKQLEAWLATRFPGVFLPSYSAITFDRMPYAKVLRMKTLQEALLARLQTASGEPPAAAQAEREVAAYQAAFSSLMAEPAC